MTNKLGYSSAIVFSFAYLDWIGFVEKGQNSPETILHMMTFYIVPATIVNVAVAAIMWRFPLDETKHRAIRAILEERGVIGTVVGARLGHMAESESGKPDGALAAKPAE